MLNNTDRAYKVGIIYERADGIIYGEDRANNTYTKKARARSKNTGRTMTYKAHNIHHNNMPHKAHIL